MSARFFIRNDDVWTLDKEFRFFFDVAIDHGIPVVHAVIPGKINKATVRFLCRAKEKNPRLLDIVQHGWMHTNHSLRPGIKYEFGTTRSFHIQHEDIQKGAERMRLAFGSHLTSAFVPPYHGYDQRTLKILDEEGFKIFSAGTRRVGLKTKCMELPAQVSFSQYGPGQARIPDLKDVVGNLVKHVGRRPLTGVVMHHADFNTLKTRKTLNNFFKLVEAQRNEKAWQVLLFSDLEK